jgi:hypothetical protein
MLYAERVEIKQRMLSFDKEIENLKPRLETTGDFDLKQKIEEMKRESAICSSQEQAIKLLLN